MIPFEIQAISVMLWTLIAAFIIAPAMVWKKIKKHGSTPEDIKRDVTQEIKKEIQTLESNFDTKLQEYSQKNIDPEIFRPMVKAEMDDQREIINQNLDKLQKAIPGYLLQTLQTQEAGDLLLEIMKTGSQSLIGAAFRSKGIDEQRFTKGMEITKEWFIENVENVNPAAPEQLQAAGKILKAIFPEEGDWIQEKLGALQVLQQQWHLLFPNQNNNHNNSSPHLSQGSRSIPGNFQLQHQGARL